MELIDKKELVEKILLKYPSNGTIKKMDILNDIEEMKIMHMQRGYTRLGKIAKNINGTPMQVIKDIDSRKVEIQFLDEFEHVKICAYNHFLDGKVRNPYDKTKLGIGYLGVPKIKVDKIIYKKAYNKWASMFERCYSNKQYTTYANASVCEEWHNFQNFLSWFVDNYFEEEGDFIELDKDIVKKNNKTYSPDTCILVPREINRAVLKRKSGRNDYPIGVNYRCENKKYYASHGNIKIGYFDTIKEAFEAYKKFVEQRLSDLANKYKDKITERAYNAIINYKVEVDD